MEHTNRSHDSITRIDPPETPLPDDPDRLRVFFDRGLEDHQKFLSDPGIPAIAQEFALDEPPVKTDPVGPYDA